MDVFQTSGAFSWSELITPNAKAATEYYGKLFGWTFDTMDVGQGPYHVVKIGETAIGGIMSPPPGQPIPTAWGCYVTVADIDATAKQATQLGGKVLMPPFEIPGVGRMAVLQDPQGAVLSAITYAPRPK